MALLCLAGLASGQTSGEGSTGSDDGTGPTIGEEGEGSLGIQLGYYDHSDGGGDGNPFLDEDLTVIEPVIVFDYNVTDRLALGVLLSYDNVSSASIERLNDHPLSEQSGASGDYYGGGDFSLNYQWNRDWTIGGHAGLSIEYDYTSIGLGLNASQALQDADATMSYSVDAYLDSIDVIDYAGRNRGSDSRTSISGTVGWYQILSPTSHGTFGLTLAQQNGFLQTAYNGVVVEDGIFHPNNPGLATGFETTEELPDSRTRLALYGRVRNSLGRRAAYEVGGRLYSDTWGVSSLTLEPRYYFTMVDDFLDLRLRYRFYTQTEADDFSEHFTTAFASVDEHRTQDSDLGAYDAHTIGAKWTFHLEDDDSFFVGVDYTLRSDGIDQLFGGLGWSWSF